jgi:hypothetical protein
VPLTNVAWGGVQTGLAATVIAAIVIGSGVGCEGASSDVSHASASKVPSEITARLTAIEKAMNDRDAIALAPNLDDGASIQAVALLGYGSKAQFLKSLESQGSQSTFKFGETVLVSERPGRIRTVSEVVRTHGEEQVVDRVSHDWIRRDDQWVLKEQNFPDWSPLVGHWWRSEGGARLELKLMPSGVFSMFDASGIEARSGVFSSGSDEVTFTPDALGSGATAEQPISASFKFEFDGSLEIAIVSGREAEGIPSLGGVWKRQSMR